MSNVGFTGTRDGMTPAQHEGLQQLLATLAITTFHHGDCVGADAEAHALVVARYPSVPIIIHPPCYTVMRAFCVSSAPARKPQDYIKRNHAIVRDTDFLIATPAEMQEQIRSGTWATIRYARQCHKSIYMVLPNGDVKYEKPLKAVPN